MASASEGDMDYLAPDFDPSSLTVPRLRSILVTHDVKYPSSAKKAQLIDLFNKDVVPQSRRILSAHSRTKRTSKGITDVDSSQEGATTAEDDALTMPPPPTIIPRDVPRPRDGPRSERPVPNVEVTVAPRPDSPEKGLAVKKSSSKHGRESDLEPGLVAESKRPMMRKTRHSEVAASPKVEQTEKPVQREPAADSVFSDDNPFQSGSSPLSGPDRRTSGGRRKKSMGPSVVKDGTRRTSTHRLSKVKDGIVVPTTDKFEMQIAKPKTASGSTAMDDNVEPGEEFTPEEQMELTREQLKDGVMDLLPPRRAKASSGGGRIHKSAPWVVLLALFGGYATWWRREKLEVGYCGVGRDTSSSLANVHIPDWAGVLQPQCEPCPPHAYCYLNMQTKCEPNFILSPHPLSLGGIIPLAPTCEPDGEKARKVKAVADRAVGELRERRAKYECGEPIDSDDKHAVVEISEKNLKEKVSEKRRKAMSQKEFEELWEGAIGEVASQEEVVVTVDAKTGQRKLVSNSLARIPLGCAVRRSARLTLARYRVELGGLIVLCLGLVSARQYLASLRDAKARVPDLVKLTLEILAAQAALHLQDPRAAPEPWISVGQLRDDVLRDEFSARRREDLWKRVRNVIELNANVRASVREARSGEVSRVWEWIGHVGLLEDGAPSTLGGGGGGQRKSGRVSLGPSMGISGSSPTPAPEDLQSRPGMLRRWDEGRPIY